MIALGHRWSVDLNGCNLTMNTAWIHLHVFYLNRHSVYMGTGANISPTCQKWPWYYLVCPEKQRVIKSNVKCHGWHAKHPSQPCVSKHWYQAVSLVWWLLFRKESLTRGMWVTENMLVHFLSRLHFLIYWDLSKKLPFIPDKAEPLATMMDFVAQTMSQNKLHLFFVFLLL